MLTASKGFQWWSGSTEKFLILSVSMCNPLWKKADSDFATLSVMSLVLVSIGLLSVPCTAGLEILAFGSSRNPWQLILLVNMQCQPVPYFSKTLFDPTTMRVKRCGRVQKKTNGSVGYWIKNKQTLACQIHTQCKVTLLLSLMFKENVWC